HHAALTAAASYVPPWRSTAQTTRASLLASATTTVFLCARSRRLFSHFPSGVVLADSEGRAARAPCTSSLRRYLLPRLLIPSRRGLPPVVIWRGTKPSQAARSRPRANVAASPIAAARAVAFNTPIPGMLAKRRAASSVLACAANSS